MKFTKVCNTVAAVVGYATMAVAAYVVADALRMTIEDEIARKQFHSNLDNYIDKNTTMGDWLRMQDGGDYPND